MFGKLRKKILESELWRSVYKVPAPGEDARGRLRVMVGSVVLHVLPAKVRRHELRLSYTWGMGGISFFLFFLEAVTGIALMVYYVPDVRRAYQDVRDLHYVVPFGALLRNAHRWAAHAMVFAACLHMLRVFLTGSYKPPRQFNWTVGVCLLVLTFLLSFTGYLLPWDQLALWAVTVGTNMARAAPFFGHEGPGARWLPFVSAESDVRYALLGGKTVGSEALLRFYALHCVVLPAIAAAGMAVHFWRVRKDGFSGPPIDPGEPKTAPDRGES